MSTEVSDLPENVPSGEPQKKDTVSYDTYKRALEQRKKDQAEKELLAAKLSELEAEKAREQEDKQRKEGDWKAILENREARLKHIEEANRELSKKADQYEKTLADAVKLNAFQNKLGGKLKKAEYLDFVDTEKILVDPETGKVDDNAVEQYAREFAKNYRELVAFDSQGTMPGGAASRTKTLSYEEWRKLPIKDKKARFNDIYNKP